MRNGGVGVSLTLFHSLDLSGAAPRLGERDGRWLLQLYDKHNTRTEVMVRKPVQKPCCSENLDPYIK